MKRSTDLQEYELKLRSETYDYRTPMKFGGRVVTDVCVVTVDCLVHAIRSRSQGKGSRGLGSMTMGVTWAWPDSSLSDSTKLEIVVELVNRFIAALNGAKLSGHPLDICREFTPIRQAIANELAAERELTTSIPELAVLLASSPIEAALFDAHGKAAGMSSYAMLSREFLSHDLAHYLGEDAYRGIFLGDLISTSPVASMPLYHLVGALDPLTVSDIANGVGDGVPETLNDWIRRDGLTHLKIKLGGDDIDWDVERVVRTYRTAIEARPGSDEDWAFSLDFNEKCENEEYVLSVLSGIGMYEPHALHALQYIEQPTHRDLQRLPTITMNRVRERIPVVIDESLVSLKSLRMAIQQGYSGIALKACKGHAEALLLGAVANHENLFLCVQDLTCVGASLLHSASLAAHIPGVTAIESNGRQYAPIANERWLTRFRDFFEVRGGQVPTQMLSGPGLGYGDDPIDLGSAI